MYGVAEASEVVIECTCCGEETTLTTETCLVSGENSLQAETQACVYSEERSVDLKRWKELMDTGINIEYRCIR